MLDKGINGDLLFVVEIQDIKGRDLSGFFDKAKGHIKADVHPTNPVHREGPNFLQYAPIRLPMTLAGTGEFKDTVLKRIESDLAPILKVADEFMAS